MKSQTMVLLCTTVFLLAGCTHSSIDARKTDTSQKAESRFSKKTTTQLTDKDVLGNEATLTVSEEDIQAALEADEFRVPLDSGVILVQSGNRAPEMLMQQEMSKYYRVSVFSGIPDTQQVKVCNVAKDPKDGDITESVDSENMNYMQALRYIAAKGKQKSVIVYWDALQVGQYDTATKNTIWSDYKNEKITDTALLRYLVRFALVDVASGEWATWSPVNYEYSVLPSLNEKTPVTEQQIVLLKQKTYAAVVKDLVSRYQ